MNSEYHKEEDAFSGLNIDGFHKYSLEFFLNVFTEFRKFIDKKYLSLEGLGLVTSCVRDQDATTTPTRHM